MPRITPPTTTGGAQGFVKAMRFLGGSIRFFIGLVIFVFTAAIVFMELILNPIFLYSQQEASGAFIGLPWQSIAWWTPIGITIATTGTQYALLQKKTKEERKTLGYTLGWTIAILDTGMDLGGFNAWVNGGNPLDLNGNSEGLTWGILPAPGATQFDWCMALAVAAICLLHEPFLDMVLGRLSFTPPPGAHGGTRAQAAFIKGAGHVHNKVKIFTMTVAPFVMLFLDVMLFTQNGNDGDTNKVRTIMSWVFTFIITAVGVAVWDYYNHLREAGRGQYKVSKLDRKHVFIFTCVMVITFGDSWFDLKGFNFAVYGEAAIIPTGAGMPWFLTAALIMIMCTFNEPMMSDLFVPLEKLGMAHPAGVNLTPGMAGISPFTPGGMGFGFTPGASADPTATPGAATPGVVPGAGGGSPFPPPSGLPGMPGASGASPITPPGSPGGAGTSGPATPPTQPGQKPPWMRGS